MSARVDGSTATVDAVISVAWPASVRTVAAQLRQRVRDDVAAVTGVQVAHIDVNVVDLSAPAARPRRRVQ